MQSEIEVRYLGLEWLERGRARRVEVAPEPLDVERRVDGVLTVESLIFHDFHPWLGLRLSGRLSSEKPAFVDAQGKRHSMLAVTDDDGNSWWVQDDGWDEIQQRQISELHRTMGRFEIHVGDERLLIENQATDIGRAEVDEYLQDFKGDLIWLVLGSGTATATGPGSPVGGELLPALSDFTAAVARVTAQPARTLREILADTPRSRLRPNAATFRQHARMPASPRLVGRASEETADTADNRYLRHMVQTCSRLALAAAGAVQQQATRWADRANFEHERSITYAETRTRAVDPEIFDRQLAERTQKLDDLAAWSNTTLDEQGDGSHEYRMLIDGPYGSSGHEFFYKNPEGRSKFDDIEGLRYNVVDLPKDLAKRVTGTLNFCKDFTLTGQPNIRLSSNKKGDKYRFVDFTRVMAVNPNWQSIVDKLRTRERLESQGWQYNITKAEHTEMQREANTAAKRAETYRQIGGDAEVACAGLAACQAALRRQDAQWQLLGVLPQSTFPMGMRYALRPDYAAVLKSYTHVRDLVNGAGLGECRVLDELDRINILHASAIYERWCLVKIVGVLMGEFNFKPCDGWQDVVIQAVTGKPECASLLFHRLDGISATLEIQPLLENGRRPDFRLQFNSDKKELSCDPPLLARGRLSSAKLKDVQATGVVLDAKFRTRWRRGALSALLTELVESKNYNQRGDRVFILQPQANAISEPTSPLIWGRHCDYGQDAPTNHRSGTIQLAAGAQSGGTLSNLRRLIAMELQEIFPAPPGGRHGETGTSESFCIRCGTTHAPGDIEHRTTQRGKAFWKLSCNQCRMLTVRTHCYDCGESLFKNGTDLTYHRTLADQITNVVCHQCGAFFDQDTLAVESRSAM
jgi:hypothetical protein